MICFVDYRISSEELINLNRIGATVIKVPKFDLLYPAIDGHVDIQINILNKASKKIIVHKDISKDFLIELEKNNIFYEYSSKSIGYDYPDNISLNAFITNNLLLHNIKYTDESLIKHFNKLKKINVKQGYTKCSVLPLSKNLAITSDNGIYKALTNNGFKVLLIPPGDILLPGLDYGFIGGVGGMISTNKLALFGNLNHYRYGNEILDFLKKYNIEPIYLSTGKLIDRGSLYVL